MMHRLIVLTAIFAMALFPASLKASDPLIEWIENQPVSSNDTLYAVGMGDGKAEALLNALVEISMQLGVRTTYYSPAQWGDESKIVATQSFGDVKIASYSTFNVTRQAANDTTSRARSFSKAAKLTYFKDGKKLFLTELLSDESQVMMNGDAQEPSFRRDFKMAAENCTLSDVVTELESNGINICRTFAAPETYCLLIECTLAKLPKSRPTAEPSDTLWTKPDDQALKELEESIRTYEEWKKKRGEQP